MEPAKQVERGSRLVYWIMGGALVLYVACCSAYRDRILEADAWEHHRAIVALTHRFWDPGNPTYATREPSVRYSPYTVTLAAICRSTGLDPYDALTGAAVFNTVLLVIGLRLLLGRFGEFRIGTAALVTMVSLWGGAPGYANSYALEDLPWHQVNPSAFSFATVLILWWVSTSSAVGLARWAAVCASVALSTVAVLDHPMTGAFGLLGLFVLAVTDRTNRTARLVTATIVAGAAVSLCLVWPWYSFLAALRWSGDKDVWYNVHIHKMAAVEWCAPAAAALVLALPLRRRPLVRTCLVGCGAIVAVSLLAGVIRSPTLARQIIPGLLFFHLPVAVFIHDCGLLALRTWPGRLRGLLDMRPETQSASAVQCLLAVGLLYCLVPQVYDILRLSHLGRPWVDRLRGRPERVPSPRPQLQRVLTSVGPGETVLSDLTTSWQVPSTSSGRIVAATHLELFVPDQSGRRADLKLFFTTRDNAVRREILNKYHVQWILLKTDEHGDTPPGLLRESAIVVREDGYVLMRADLWILASDVK